MCQVHYSVLIYTDKKKKLLFQPSRWGQWIEKWTMIRNDSRGLGERLGRNQEKALLSTLEGGERLKGDS